MLEFLRIMLDVRTEDRDERGASAVEYGLLIAGVAALIILAVFAFGGSVGDLFRETCTTVQSQTSTDC